MKALGGAAVAASLERLALAKGGAARPNVVYVFSDTHRWSSMSFTETPGVDTPNLAAMKAGGVSFDNCFSTLPICSPYRAMLMTGHWPWQQGFIANHMNLAERTDGAGERGTLGHIFADAGYATHYFGKWHLGGGDPTRYGFETASIWGGEDHTDLTYRAWGKASPFGRGKKDWSADARYTGVAAHPPHAALPRFPYKIIGETDQAIELMERHDFGDAERPLFLMLSLQDPHGPHRADGKQAYPPHIRERYREGRGLEFRPNDTVRDARWRQDYHSSIHAVDEELGRIRAKLAELGAAENTILVYTSDHGGMGGAQGVGGGQKRWPHDESTRVPFMVEWPGGIQPDKRGRSVGALLSTIDIFPTLAGLAGLPDVLKGKRGERARASLEYIQGCPGVDHTRNVCGLAGAPEPDSIFICHPSNMNNKSRACPNTRTVVTRGHVYSVRGRTRLGTRERWTGWDKAGAREWLLYDMTASPIPSRW